MSMQVEIYLKSSGAMRNVPPALANEGDDFGGNLAYSAEIIDEIPTALKIPSLFDFLFDDQPLYDQLEEEMDEDVDEDDLVDELDRRAPYFDPQNAIPTFEAIIDALSNTPEKFQGSLSEAKGLDGTLWDLRVILEILKEAKQAGEPFHLRFN